MPYVDFADVKARVSIERAIELLGIPMTGKGAQYRGACPACQSGGDRALVVTPGKGMFYCFAAGIGGDVIAFAAHIRRCKPQEAAQFLVGTVQGTVPVPSTVPETAPQNQKGALKPLDYLQADHPAVQAVGFDPETAKALGIGYAPKGLMRGSVAVPVRLEDGSLAGYIGITEAKLPPRFILDTVVVPFPKKTA
jgi:DNA primase